MIREAAKGGGIRGTRAVGWNSDPQEGGAGMEKILWCVTNSLVGKWRQAADA